MSTSSEPDAARADERVVVVATGNLGKLAEIRASMRMVAEGVKTTTAAVALADEAAAGARRA